MALNDLLNRFHLNSDENLKEDLERNLEEDNLANKQPNKESDLSNGNKHRFIDKVFTALCNFYSNYEDLYLNLAGFIPLASGFLLGYLKGRGISIENNFLRFLTSDYVILSPMFFQGIVDGIGNTLANYFLRMNEDDKIRLSETLRKLEDNPYVNRYKENIREIIIRDMVKNYLKYGEIRKLDVNKIYSDALIKGIASGSFLAGIGYLGKSFMYIIGYFFK